MSSSHKTVAYEGFVNNNPGIVAAVVATAIAVGFVGILVAGAGHHDAGHAAPHGSGSGHAAAGSAAAPGAPAKH